MAVWYFVSGVHAKLLVEWLKARPGADGRLPTHLSETDFEAFTKEVGAGAVRVEQRAGDKVVVPRGWIHWVVTVRPCVKVAWEVMEPDHLADYVLIWRDITPHLLTHPELAVADDYMATLPTVFDSIIAALDALSVLRE